MSGDNTRASVISLGGSVITNDNDVDEEFLTAFRRILTDQVPERTFYVITGGGSTARTYQQALKAVAEPDDDDLDWMGIHATRLNGHLLRFVFADIAHDELVLTPEAAQQADSSVVVGAAGATPGRSSDYASLTIAKTVGAEHVIQISDISHVYSADPDTDPNAEPLNQLTWSEYQNLVTDQWEPGLNVPIDPVSAEYAQTHDIEVAIMSGKSLGNFTAYLGDNQFTGTTITSS